MSLRLIEKDGENLEREELELLAEAREAIATKASQDDQLICECMCISIQDIRNHLAGDQVTLEKLQELKLGSGCSSCLKSFKQWRDKI